VSSQPPSSEEPRRITLIYPRDAYSAGLVEGRIAQFGGSVEAKGSATKPAIIAFPHPMDAAAFHATVSILPFVSELGEA
jgi:hypothetical protein